MKVFKERSFLMPGTREEESIRGMKTAVDGTPGYETHRTSKTGV